MWTGKNKSDCLFTESCLELQKELYRSDDRRIAETHYQIGKLRNFNTENEFI